MTPDILIACAIGAFVGGAFAFGFFAVVERQFKPRQPARMRDRDGQYMSMTQHQKRERVHAALREYVNRRAAQ